MSLDREALKNRAFALAWLLRSARTKQNLTQEACAQYLGISRQQYAKIEMGTVLISAVEYEAMLIFLNVPLNAAWPGASDNSVRAQWVTVALAPGETVHVILETR